MRKSLLILLPVLMILISVLPGAAQTIGEQLDFGFAIGPAISSASGHQFDTKSRTGLSLGGWLGYRQNDIFTLRFEFLYVSKGYRVYDVIARDSTDNIVANRDLEFIFNYLEMPLMVKLSPPLGGKYIPYLQTGIFAAYNIDNKMRLLDGVPFDFDLENANSVDFGAIFCIGIDMKSGPGWLVVETRYEASLTEIIKHEKQKLRVLSIRLGYGW